MEGPLSIVVAGATRRSSGDLKTKALALEPQSGCVRQPGVDASSTLVTHALISNRNAVGSFSLGLRFALPVLRRTKAPQRRFRLRGGVIISMLALLLSGWLLANSTWYEAVTTAIVAAAGLVIYLGYRVTVRLRGFAA